MAELAGQEGKGNSFFEEARVAEKELNEYKKTATIEQLEAIDWINHWFIRHYNAGLKHLGQILRDGFLRKPKA